MNTDTTNPAEEFTAHNQNPGSSQEERDTLPIPEENEEIIGQAETPPETKPEGWKEKYDELNDRFLRLYSEFDNFKKRTARERIEFVKTASADIFASLLPVLDDFDRAAKVMENATEINSLKEGMQLIHHKFKGVLVAKGLEEMNAQGEVFNSDMHEAITSIPAPEEHLKGKVVDQLEKGYALNGKVIRFAKVVVGN